jgi:SAM-dependent methyltransferase
MSSPIIDPSHLDTNMTADAATRFYQRSHQVRVSEVSDVDFQPLDMNDKSQRYYGAAREMDFCKPVTALELGYGSPRTVHAVAPRASGEYHIADIVDRSHDLTLPPNVRMHVCNLDNRFVFADASFDFVVAMMVVEHLYDPFHALSEIARVLKPGGTLAMNLPNIASLRCRLALLVGKMPITSQDSWFEKREWDGNHLHSFTVADTVRLAALYGLRFKRLYPVGNHVALKRVKPSLLCHEITYIFEKPVAG